MRACAVAGEACIDAVARDGRESRAETCIGAVARDGRASRAAVTEWREWHRSRWATAAATSSAHTNFYNTVFNFYSRIQYINTPEARRNARWYARGGAVSIVDGGTAVHGLH